MNDIIEEARAMLAGLRSHPWRRDRDMVQGAGCILVAKCIDADAAGFIAASPRLLAALADECERLRAENARLREAMIDVAYWERCRAHEDTVEGTYSPYTRDEYAREFHDDLLARLDAAKEVR